MKTISITLYNRSKYTKILLDHLNKCFNIDQYQIFIYCEPEQEEVIELAKSFRPNQTTITINPYKFGCNKNIFQAIDNGFQINNFHIHLEDDTIPAKDFLRYCEWANQTYVNNHNIFSVSGYVNSNNKIEQYIEANTEFNKVKIRNWFTPWGWATWKNRWMHVRNYIIPILNNPNISWDLVLHKIVSLKSETFPMVSRIQNIGAENGAYCPGADWHRHNQYNEYWIETSNAYQEKFIEDNNV
jgi:hypothetical protein